MSTTASATSDLALDLRHVAKTYRGKVHALRGIDMRVGRGEIFGLLGPNGAGKSTLVKILMTVISPTRCEGTMLGQPVGHKPTLGRVGYLPEHHRFPDYLSGAQVLDHYAALAGVPRRERRKRVPMLLDLVDMGEWSKVKVRSYSKGMRQRIGLGQALMNDPDIVLLDEPTDGVDPVGRRDIRRILQRLRSEGTTVFINSHILSELEMVCDRVAILVQGVVARQGSLDSLTRDQERYEVDVGASDIDAAVSVVPGHFEAAAPTPMAAPGARLSYHGMLHSGEAVEVGGGRITIRSADPTCVQPVIDAIRGAGIAIMAVRPMRPSLEDLFMAAVTDPRTGQTLHLGAEKGRKPAKAARP